MQHRTVITRALALLVAAGFATLALGCELIPDTSEAVEQAIQQQQQQPAQVDCTDPAENPYAGTCVESFIVDCFDPAGACVGEVSQAGVDLTWANGAEVLNTIDTSNPYSPRTSTEIVGSTGAVCATGLTVTNATDQTAECYSETTYTRAGDGARLTFCTRLDTSQRVTCDDGSSFEVDSQAAGGASVCQYGSEAGACEIEMSEDMASAYPGS